jgi:putative oxidoreductase
MDTGLFIIRVVVGLLLVGHGTQKLFGWFGGHGLKPTAAHFHGAGYRPGHFFAAMAGATEAGGGLLLALGLVNPLAAAAVVGVMLNAAAMHWPKGLWATKGGYEYPLVLGAVGAGLAFTGPGAASLDHLFGWSLEGVGWGVAAVAVGLATGVATLAVKHLRVPAAV